MTCAVAWFDAAVCGACCRSLLDAGAARAPGQHVISLGRQCELHPTAIASQATNVLRVPSDVAAVHRRSRDADAEELNLIAAVANLELAMAPSVTEVAARLLAAGRSCGFVVDDEAIAACVRSARKLIAATKGT